jgi:hypothetical protein
MGGQKGGGSPSGVFVLRLMAVVMAHSMMTPNRILFNIGFALLGTELIGLPAQVPDWLDHDGGESDGAPMDLAS